MLAAFLAALSLAGPATAPPIGPLPTGPVTTIQVRHGLPFALALPHRRGGLVWRGARNSNLAVARPIGEADVGANVVLTYRALRAGRTTLAYALTRGETAKVYEARYFRIVVF
jgi:hypothetical protein